MTTPHQPPTPPAVTDEMVEAAIDASRNAWRAYFAEERNPDGVWQNEQDARLRAESADEALRALIVRARTPETATPVPVVTDAAVEDRPAGWTDDDELNWRIGNLCEAAYAFADSSSDRDIETCPHAAFERQRQAELKALVAKLVQAAKVRDKHVGTCPFCEWKGPDRSDWNEAKADVEGHACTAPPQPSSGNQRALKELLGRLHEWSLRHGAELNPTAGSADSFGDGMREAKRQIQAMVSVASAEAELRKVVRALCRSELARRAEKGAL